MSAPWWVEGAAPTPDREPTRSGAAPTIAPATVAAARAEPIGRIAAFTPEWTVGDEIDAGVALLRTFGNVLVPVLDRVNRLPEKILVEHLDTAGVRRGAARPSRVVVQFSAADTATESILVPRGHLLDAAPADGDGDRVVFETERDLWVTSAPLALAVAENGVDVDRIDVDDLDDTTTLRPFGDTPRPGAALWLGFDGEATPSPAISLAFTASAPDMPPPVARGARTPPAPLAPPNLSWEVLDGGRFVPAELVIDETAALQRGGLVELRLPRQWRPGPPRDLGFDRRLRWLRALLTHGEYPTVPELAGVSVNMVRARATRTVRDEPLTPSAVGPGDRRTQALLSQTPVVQGSLRIEVDEGPAADVFGIGAAEPGTTTRIWTEIEDLSNAGPRDRRFQLDPTTGTVTFGDGRTGARIPAGFRNVRALEYQVGSGADGAIEAEANLGQLTTIPLVTGASNPAAASGGFDEESNDAAIRRGPARIRARERAVAPSDYALLAPEAPGADVARAHAIRGLHPSFPGAAIPGVVTVLLVRTQRGDGPPVPDAATLDAVADHLVDEVAPVGVQVVAAAPRFVAVSVDARVAVQGDADVGTTVQRTLDEIDEYLDPIRGGDDGTGWPFGGTLHHDALVTRLLDRVESLAAVMQLAFVVDGVRHRPCEDRPLARDALAWPGGHQLRPVPGVAR